MKQSVIVKLHSKSSKSALPFSPERPNKTKKRILLTRKKRPRRVMVSVTTGKMTLRSLMIAKTKKKSLYSNLRKSQSMRIMKEMIMMSQKKLNPNLNLRLIKIQNLLKPSMMIVMDIILRKNNQNTLVITLLQICLRD